MNNFGPAGPANTPANAAIAAHRFGMGEPDLAVVAPDPGSWLLAQIGPADAQHGNDLPGIQVALERQVQARKAVQTVAAASAADPARDPYRETITADIRARLSTSASTSRPFAERLALFWSNHFSVSNAKGSSRGLVGAFEREAIRPHIAGKFADMLVASTTHPAMLRYLDNSQSAGPNSRAVIAAQRRAQRQPDSAPPRLTGLNENLGREVLELHTLGVAEHAYTQADVTGLAAVLSGWRGPVPDRPANASAPDASGFDANWHEPGDKTVLGLRWAEGPQALPALLRRLAQHPSTARFIATKLARHFVADVPPPALIERLAGTYLDRGGDLPAVYAALVVSPEAWQEAPQKLKSPEEFVISCARMLRLGDKLAQRAPDGGIAALGQRLQAPTSPAGWPDRAEDWIGPEAVWQRVEWVARMAERMGGSLDARSLAVASLGPRLTEATRLEIDRAADGTQALSLLLLAPEFQRR